ncbi:acyl carrier protein [Micromonospora sp. WMMD712]|uniref:acyl carrier protein n=1 Tax=Micromonospora TaxID=1873 RepID=UPI002499AD63|nr:acyl carrier protein [Micromonospora sp. WMMD712]WFE58704.1 acyl carrier protein [Micromonospora sp. WMMD712]
MTTLTEDQLLDRVRAAWAEVLDVDDPGSLDPDQNFLEAGGSSLLLIMLWEDLHELTERSLRVADLFQHATIRAQARLLAGGGEEPRQQVTGASQRRALLGRARTAEVPRPS